MGDPAFSTLLESLDDAGAEKFGAGWDARLTERLESLAASYGDLRNPKRKLINYGNVTSHAAYMYTYAQCRAEFVYQILKGARVRKGTRLFDDTELNVCSLGGGPGTELIGLLRYLGEEDNEEIITDVTYHIFDKDGDWEDTASALCDAIVSEINVDFKFSKIDVSDKRECSSKSFSEFDLIILSYFISEVAELPEKAAVIACLNHLLGSVASGASVLYCDNDAYTFYSFFNSRRHAAGQYDEVYELQQQIIVEPHDAEVYQDILERTGRNQHLNGKMLAKYLVRIN